MASWSLLLHVVYVLNSPIFSSASAVPSFSLFQRSNESAICAVATSSASCPAGVRFCCPAQTSCILTTTSEDSVLCCANGQDCSSIIPITCNIQSQNITRNPGSSVQTTRLHDSLPTCGSQCCPFGYECRNNSVCSLPITNSTSTASPTGTSSTSSSGGISEPTNTAVVKPTAEPVVTPIASPNNNTASATSPPAGFSGKSFAAGFVPGIVLGSILTVALFFLVRRWARKADKRPRLRRWPSSPSFMGRTPTAALHSGPTTNEKQPISSPRATHDAHSSSAGNLSNISEPLGSTLTAPAPQRADFLLRRGSCETGYENSVKPSWSTRRSSKFRPLPANPQDMHHVSPMSSVSRFATPGTGASSSHLVTPESQRPASKDRTPLFPRPLRFGPGPDATPARVTHGRPEMVQDAARGSMVATVVGSGTEAKRNGSVSSPPPKDPRRNMTRTDSDESVFDEDREVHAEGSRPRYGSGETIKIMMTPPPGHSLYPLPERRDTRFSEFMH